MEVTMATRECQTTFTHVREQRRRQMDSRLPMYRPTEPSLLQTGHPMLGAPEVRYCPIVKIPRLNNAWCDLCNHRLLELKRQAFKLLVPNPKNKALLLEDPTADLAFTLCEKLAIPDAYKRNIINDQCTVCSTHVHHLKREAIAMVQNVERHGDQRHTRPSNLQYNSASVNRVGRLSNTCYSPQQNRNLYAQARCVPTSIPLAQTIYNDGQNNSWTPDPNRNGQMLSPPPPMPSYLGALAEGRIQLNRHSPKHPPPGMAYPSPNSIQSGQFLLNRPASPFSQYQQLSNTSSPTHGAYNVQHGTVQYTGYQSLMSVDSPCSPGSPVHSPSGQHPSAAASFFARAAQKLAKKKRRREPPEPEPPPFPTRFNDILRNTPPPAPPGLMRGVGRPPPTASGSKVKVMLRVCRDQNPNIDQGPSFISADSRKKQVTIYDPSTFNGYSAPSQRKAGVAAPKMFGFDAVFSQDDSLAEVCSSSLTEIVQAVVNGMDGCLFCYGQSKTGNSMTMVGADRSFQTLGIIPCAISWLFRLINEQKDKTGARFSVRVSAVEVAGKGEILKDLLSDAATGTEAGCATSPGVYLREDPISGTQLENQSELRAPSADKAGYYLDAALSSRTQEIDDEKRMSHLLFTLHVYQYRVEKDSKGGAGAVTGGRSRLHLVDIGTCAKTKEPDTNALTLSALGNVILALLNGQRHIPHRESKLSQLLKESLGNLQCRTAMVAQVSPLMQNYNETLQVVQLAARLHRMRRRKISKVGKMFSGTSSEESSSCDSEGSRFLRRPIRPRMGVLREGIAYTNALSSHSDPEYTSSSEQSCCDTVIFMGRNAPQSLSDRELTDTEGAPKMGRAVFRRGSSRGGSSEDEGNISDSSRKSGRSGITMGTAAVRKRSLSSPSASQQDLAGQIVQLPRKLKPRKMEIDPNNPPQELWIDGPQASETKEEQWVDGPPKFVDKQLPSGEQWIDGPREMRGEHSRHHKHRMHKQMLDTGSPHPGVAQAAVLHPSPQHHPAAPPSTPHHHHHHPAAPPSTPHHHHHRRERSRELTLVDKYHQKIDQKQSSRDNSPQHNNISADPQREATTATVTATSTVVETRVEATQTTPPDQREPETVDSNKVNNNPVLEEGKLDAASAEGAEYMQVKPFVRDWVEKHSLLSSTESSLHAEADQQYDTRLGYDSLLKQKTRDTREQSPSHQRIKHLERERSSSQSPKTSSPAVSSKFKSELKKRMKKNPVPVAGPNARVAEWVHSIDGQFDEGSGQYHSLPRTKLVVQETDCVRRHESPKRCRSKSKDYCTGDECSRTLDWPIERAIEKSVERCVELETDDVFNRQSMYEIQAESELEASLDTRLDEDDCSKRELTPAERKSELCAVNPIAVAEQLEAFIQAQQSEPLSPTFSEEEELKRASCLRRPDGASNPSLNKVPFSECGSPPSSAGFVADDHKSPSRIFNYPPTSVTIGNVVHDELKDSSKLPTPNKTKCKPPLPKPSQKKVEEKPRKSSLPLFGLKCGRSASAGPSQTEAKEKSQLPQRSASASPVSSHSDDGTKAGGGAKPKIPIPTKDSKKKETKLKKEKDVPKEKKKEKEVLKSPEKTKNAKSSPLKGSPLFRKDKNKDKVKDPKKDKKSKESTPVKESTPTKSKEQTKLLSSSKASSSKRRDDFTVISSQPRALPRADSDSGHDSGIVAPHHKTMLSPYSAVTKPRVSTHSSSGHGSDVSSNLSARPFPKHHLARMEKCRGGASSGYESMIRDSEANSNGSNSDGSTGEKTLVVTSTTKQYLKKKSGTRRSRSAPARTPDSPTETSCLTSPLGCRKALSPPPHWVDSSTDIYTDDMEVKQYSGHEVERVYKRRIDELRMIKCKELRYQKIRELLTRQEELKVELAEAKERLMIEPDTWSFDLHVAEQVDWDDVNYLEALERETKILEKRVDACKSHIMLVTCFDISV